MLVPTLLCGRRTPAAAASARIACTLAFAAFCALLPLLARTRSLRRLLRLLTGLPLPRGAAILLRGGLLRLALLAAALLATGVFPGTTRILLVARCGGALLRSRLRLSRGGSAPALATARLL